MTPPGSFPPSRKAARARSAARSWKVHGRSFWPRASTAPAWARSPRSPGVSKGTLYVYFDSKESLFEALTTEEKRGLAEVLFKLDAEDPDVRGALTRLGLSYLRRLGKPEHVSSIRMVMGAAEKFPRLGQAFYEAGPCQGIARLSAYFDRQVEAGRLSIEDTGVAAQHLLDLCVSGILRRMLFSVGEPPTESEIQRNVENAIRVFFAAYGPQDPASDPSAGPRLRAL